MIISFVCRSSLHYIYLFYSATLFRFSFYMYHLFSELVFTVWPILFNDISVLVCSTSLLDYDFLFSVCFDLFVCFKNCWQCTILSTHKKEKKKKKRNRLALEFSVFLVLIFDFCLEISDWNVLWQFHWLCHSTQISIFFKYLWWGAMDVKLVWYTQNVCQNGSSFTWHQQYNNKIML